MPYTRVSGSAMQVSDVMQSSNGSQLYNSSPSSTTSSEHDFVVEEKLDAVQKGQTGSLQVAISTYEYEGYESCTRLEAIIFQKLTGAKEYTEIGEMICFVVDKDTKASTQGKSFSAKAWIQELLRQDDRTNEDQTHGVREAAQTLFTKTGAVRAHFKQYAKELSADQFLFIDTCQLYDNFRVPGAGRQPMRMFLELLPQVFETEGEEAQTPCILNPAQSSDVTIDNGKSVVDIEKGLIRAYGKNGFEVWLQGDEMVEGSLTLMGRMV